MAQSNERYMHYAGFWDGYRGMEKRRIGDAMYDTGYETGVEAKVLEVDTDPVDGVSYEYESYIKL